MMYFSTRKGLHGWYISVSVRNTSVDLGCLRSNECSDLAAKLREVADEIDPITLPEGSVCHACDGTGIVPPSY